MALLHVFLLSFCCKTPLTEANCRLSRRECVSGALVSFFQLLVMFTLLFVDLHSLDCFVIGYDDLCPAVMGTLAYLRR